MSRLVNDLASPALFEAIAAQSGPRNLGALSVSELIAPPRARQLMLANPDLPEAASGALWRAFGSGVHMLIEAIPEARRAELGMVCERRLWAGDILDGEGGWHSGIRRSDAATFERLAAYVGGQGWRWCGKPDVVYEKDYIVRLEGHAGILQRQAGDIEDLKVTKCFAVSGLLKGGLRGSKLYGPKLKEEWEQQLNLYAELQRRQGRIQPNRLYLTAILKDWAATGLEAERQREQMPFLTSETLTLEAPLWPREQALALVRERLLLHAAAERELPLCSSAERWGGRRCEKWCGAFGACTQANPAAYGPASDDTLEEQLRASLAHLASGREGA
jgi:hypothetical protein